MAENVAGSGKEKDSARKVTSFDDMWKVSASEPNAVRNVYAFRDAFESLVFAQSLLERLSDDGKVHSPFFTGGSGAKVRYFED
jgi:hypothetical protein